jgi:hypothetical protein
MWEKVMLLVKTPTTVLHPLVSVYEVFKLSQLPATVRV